MTFLGVILSAKILVTLVFLVGPFMFLRAEALDDLSGFGHPIPAFYRLYAMALLALVVAYTGGLLQAFEGTYPAIVVAMGLTSNIGAAAIMMLSGYARTQKVMTGFFAVIGLGFAFAMIWPEQAMMMPFG